MCAMRIFAQNIFAHKGVGIPIYKSLVGKGVLADWGWLRFHSKGQESRAANPFEDSRKASPRSN